MVDDRVTVVSEHTVPETQAVIRVGVDPGESTREVGPLGSCRPTIFPGDVTPGDGPHQRMGTPGNSLLGLDLLIQGL